MASVIHIAEVAAILAVAYGLGWLIGYVAHRLVAREPASAAIPAERIAAMTGVPEDALVKAPVLEPVSSGPPPALEPVKVEPVVAVEAEPAPVPETVAAVVAEPAATPLPPVAIPVVDAPPPMRVEPVAPPPRPQPEPEPEIALTATPALKPGEAWSGEVRGRAAAQVAAEPPAEAIAEAATQLDVPLTLDLGPVGPDSTYGEPVLPPPPAPVDEDAAMRAIEGGWSRTRATALPDTPELSDVGAAVAAAQSAVEQVLAKAGIEAEAGGQTARPKGLPRPRNGIKDDLKRIDGLGALDESTLNNLGVFHFDQIAGWNEAQVLWMENHVFARGRLGRENWQQQARDLGASAG